MDHGSHEEVKTVQNCCQSHYHLLIWIIWYSYKYRTVWVTFSNYFLLDASVFTGLCNLDSSVPSYLSQVTATSWEAINHLNCLIVERTGSVERTGFMLME